METILHWDRALFHLINQTWTNTFLDWLMPIVRNRPFSVPVYLFIILFVILKRKGDWLWFLICGGACPVLTDFVSSKLIKKNFWRYRPCADPVFGPYVRNIINYCPEHSSSFTSSHAATYMGLAVFFFFTLHKWLGNWSLLFFVWAGLIMYAQVYVGVHYPTDILCGAIVGSLIGYAVATLYNKKYCLA